jgi:hypothetical protein
VPLASAVYNSGALTVTLFPKGKGKLPRMLELKITAVPLLDTLGRSLDNSHNYVVTLSKSGTTIMSEVFTGDAGHRATLATVPGSVSATRFVPHGPAGLGSRKLRG